ncbi:copper(I)-binding protein [Blastococcus colisei]|uniref:Copper(I)-binding protein n=2 Tax=Blastococcus colisei TaxID=1564162 RepID=A0A543PI30_9ACTN|nr:copper(I)-binding protein [Blastococcus colisei]
MVFKFRLWGNRGNSAGSGHDSFFVSSMFSRSHPILSRLTLAAAFALIGPIAGCGSGPPVGAPSTSSPPSATTAPAGGAIEHVQATLGELSAGDGYVREPASPSVAAAYLTIVNNGDTDDRLIFVTSDVAAMVMPMTETSEDGVGTMTDLDEVVVPAHDAFRFRSGAAHLMLEPLKTAPAAGDTVTLTLTFERAGAVDIVLPVEPINAPLHHGADGTD